MANYYINPRVQKGHINPELQGHFSEHLGRCIYEGLYVGENSDIPNVNGMRTDVVEALKEIQVPVLRWPGGCFADEYHWMDGIGPNDLELQSLVDRVANGGVEEIILALNPTMEGDTTNFYIQRKIAGSGVRLSVLARGVSVGDDLEYTDEVTLGRSIINRTILN